MTQYIFNISGTHCNACKILSEDILSEQDFIKNPVVNLETRMLTFESETTDQEELVTSINALLDFYGYNITPIL